MAQVTVTVNGQSVKSYLEAERDQEIRSFYQQEMRSMSRVVHRQIVSVNRVTNVSKVEQVGNGSIRCA